MGWLTLLMHTLKYVKLDFFGLGISASFSSEAASGSGREILVQHLLVKEDDLKLLVELQQRVSSGFLHLETYEYF